MLRWIGGCALVAVLVFGIALFVGYRKLETFADEGPASSIAILATPERVFASLADPDSMTEWRAEGLGIRSSRRGPLTVGDSIVVQTSAGPSGPQRATWYVTSALPGRLLALEMRDSTGFVFATRRDSLAPLGDSTLLVSSFAAPVMDSIRSRRADSGRGESRMVDMTSKLIIGAMRVQSNVELSRLKRRIEGDSLHPPPQ